MFIKQLGNLSALRTFRVLRALKTVAVVPGKYDIGYIYIYIMSPRADSQCYYHNTLVIAQW